MSREAQTDACVFVNETATRQAQADGGMFLNESVATAATAFIPIVGRGPGMSLADVGGGLAGAANA